MADGKEVCSTCNKRVPTSAHRAMTTLQPCDHEEADTRIILHVLDACLCENKRVMIKTRDTDVVVLAISFFSKSLADERWIAYGAGRYVRFIPVHKIATSISLEKAVVLPPFTCLYWMRQFPSSVERARNQLGIFGKYILI